jgi:biopolymer transport protein ExbD
MCGIAASACLCALVPAQDVKAVGKRLAEAVKAGELTRWQANVMLSHLRKERQAPKREDAKAADAKAEPTVTLDIVPADGVWLVEVGGRRYPFGKELTAALDALAKAAPEPDSTPASPLSSLGVLLRAPTDAPYVEVQHLIQVCSLLGVYKIECAVKLDAAAVKPTVDPPPAAVPAEEMRVAIFWDPVTRKARRVSGHITILDDEHLVQLIRDSVVRRWSLDLLPPVVIVDAADAAPWIEVMNVVHLAKAEGVTKIEFATGRRFDTK